jgi:peptide/nickel transport system permease protein
VLRYTLGRLVSAVPVLLVVSLVSFAIIALVPGDMASEMAGPSATAEELARLRTQLGLDKPIPERMLDWYAALLLHGDLGESVLLRQSVTAAILERLPVTLSLTFLALMVAILLGVLAGMIAAVRPNTWSDQGVMATALVGLSLPDFWLGLVFIWIFAVQLGWLRAMAMPAGCLALTQMGLLARITRASMLDVLRQDFVRTARAKGLPGWVVVAKHAGANVLVPVLTVAGVATGILLGGAVVIEQVFSLPGVGRLIIGAIQRRDYPVIQGGLLLTASIFVADNLVVDLL